MVKLIADLDHIACSYCGENSPTTALHCQHCDDDFGFMQKAVEQWQAEDYYNWLYATHWPLCERVEALGIASLNHAQKLNYLVGYFHFQIMNGGIWQYFFNPCGPDAPQLVAALNEIGAKNIADLVDACLDYFPNKQPPDNMEERAAILDTIPEEHATELEEKITALVDTANPKKDVLRKLYNAC